jgi:hypothetical protein
MWSFDGSGRLCFDGTPVPQRLEKPIFDLIMERNDLERRLEPTLEERYGPEWN